MELFLYDLFVFLNFVAFCVAVADKNQSGRLKKLFTLSALVFGGCGSAIACWLLRHRTRSGGAFWVTIAGIVQLLGFLWLKETLF